MFGIFMILAFVLCQDCFKPGCGIQIKSKCSGRCLRVLPSGHVDCFGSQGNDYSGMNAENIYCCDLINVSMQFSRKKLSMLFWFS